MKYIDNKLVLTKKEKEDMWVSINVLYNDQCTRGDYKGDMRAHEGYIVARNVAIQLGVISDNDFMPIKPMKRSYEL